MTKKNSGNLYSAEGVKCIACGAGKQPEPFMRNECQDCMLMGEAAVSPNGAACVDCEAGKEPKEDRSGCNSCDSGYASDGTKCVACAPGTESNDDKSACTPCMLKGDNMFSADGVRCKSCDEGKQPFT
eukprot:COSAG05_NODE_11669_length_502_cov_224.317618_1_plen_127_part_10